MTILTRRWYGVSGWAVVMALLAGVLAWWMLPRHLPVQRWVLPGTVVPQILTAEGVLKASSLQIRHDSQAEHGVVVDQFTCHLHIHDGSYREEKLALVEFPDEQLVGLKLRKDPHPSPGIAETYQLTDRRDEVVETLPLVEKDILITNDYIMLRSLSSPLPHLPHELRTVGQLAMTPDHHWLILQYRRDQAWKPLHDKLLSWWPWLAMKLPASSGCAILLYDRQTKEQYRINPGSTQLSPHAPGSEQPLLFLAAGDSSGFIVASYPNLFGNPSIIPGTCSTISWYTLPPRFEVWRWAVILGCVLLPVCFSWLRRKRVNRGLQYALTSEAHPIP
jgi:hypothetical protein